MWFSVMQKRRMLPAAALLVASAAFLFPSHAMAQAVAIAEVDGYVVDPAGAGVVGAQVKMTEVDKQQVHQTVTDAQGRYALPNLPTGPYQLEVTSKGFKDYVQTGITLQVANNVQLNVTMQLGSISERVEVAANAEMGGPGGPKPGEGPSRQQRDSGLYYLLFVGIAGDGRQVRVAVRGDRDPGYGSTSKMIAECAVCLLRDTPQVPGGIWTPGAAMGDALIRRLVDHAGLTFEVET